MSEPDFSHQVLGSPQEIREEEKLHGAIGKGAQARPVWQRAADGSLQGLEADYIKAWSGTDRAERARENSGVCADL